MSANALQHPRHKPALGWLATHFAVCFLCSVENPAMALIRRG